jgi:hypothetical protein
MSEELGIESAGNPYRAPRRWPRMAFRLAITAIVATLAVLFLLPSETRDRINGDDYGPTIGMSDAQLHHLDDVCEIRKRQGLQKYVRYSECTVELRDGTWIRKEGM